jgi:hypothetical protein
MREGHHGEQRAKDSSPSCALHVLLRELSAGSLRVLRESAADGRRNPLRGMLSHVPFQQAGWGGVVTVALLHMGPTEFVYYWAHRLLHHHTLYGAYHSHHHKSFVTEPISGEPLQYDQMARKVQGA